MSMPYTTTLDFDAVGQLHVVIGDLQIYPGVSSTRVSFPVQLTANWLDPEQPAATTTCLITGTAWTDQPLHRWLTGVQPRMVAIRGYGTQEDLEIDLSDEHFIALERQREEGDVLLQLKLQFTLIGGPAGVYPVREFQMPYRVARSRWLELLDQAGREIGVVVRVPSPLTDSTLEPAPAVSAPSMASLSQATARLRRAQDELRDHRWEQCVATCRLVLDNIGMLTMTADETGDAKMRDRTQVQRWAAIYRDVRSLTSAAHHDDETTAGFVWTRADAEAILAVTAGLLRKLTD